MQAVAATELVSVGGRRVAAKLSPRGTAGVVRDAGGKVLATWRVGERCATPAGNTMESGTAAEIAAVNGAMTP